MVQELAEVKNECVQTKLETNGLKKTQLTMERDIKTLQYEIKSLESTNDTMELDMDELNDIFQSKLGLIDNQ